jgi:prepilin-type N-terminal cleavage/methylation domain-containing protein
VQKSRSIKKHSAHGFTIIEALVAVAILSIGILATAKMQDQSIRGNFVSKRINTSVFFASGEIERRAGLSYANATDSNNDGVGGLFDIGGAADHTLIYTQNGHTFNISINVAEDEPVNDVKTINVIVTHNNNRVTEFPYILRRD